MKSLIILALSLFTWSASAQSVAFENFEELLQAFYKGGIDTIIDIPGSAYKHESIFVYTPEVQDGHAMGLKTFAARTNSSMRVPALDYVVATPLIGPVQVAEAYVIADKFLCFNYRPGIFGRPIVAADFIRCLTFPRSVSEVLRAVQAKSAESN